jgi:hypothetical protein
LEGGNVGLSISVVPFSIGLIFIILQIMLSHKKGKRLDKEEKKLIVAIAIISAGTTFFFSIPAWLQLYNVPPPDLFPIALILGYIGLAILFLIITAKILLHFRKPIEAQIREHYRKRLLKEIRIELNREITEKRLIIAPNEKEDVLKELTVSVVYDVMNGRVLPTYGVYDVLDKNCVKLNRIVFTMSKEHAFVLAKRMTELYNNGKYRKRAYRYSSLLS